MNIQLSIGWILGVGFRVLENFFLGLILELFTGLKQSWWMINAFHRLKIHFGLAGLPNSNEWGLMIGIEIND